MADLTAAALALLARGDPTEAERRLRRAERLGLRSGDSEVTAQARMSLAYALLEQGRMRAAIAAADRAAPGLAGTQSARLQVQRATVLARSGRTRAALDAYTAALPALGLAGDDLWRARALNNRALLLAYLGDPRAAQKDLGRARELALAVGETVLAAWTLCNLAWIAGMSGDIPRALALYEEAEVECAGLDVPERHVDRAEVLLRAGLYAEARAAAEQVAGTLVGSGWESLRAEAVLLHAQCALAAGDPDTAAREGDRAARLLAAQGRAGWQRLADYVRVRARPGDAGRSLRVARQLEQAGWTTHAADLRLAVAAAALDAGRGPAAARVLAPLAATRTTRPSLLRRVLHARGLVAAAEGDFRRADRELRRTWDRIEADRELRGAAELRALVAPQARDLVATGLRLAVDRGSEAATLAWAERGRAAHLRHPRVRPPRDRELAAALDELRTAAREEEQTLLDGASSSPAAGRRARAERRVVTLARTVPGAGPVRWRTSARSVRSALDPDTVVVQYAEVRGALVAVVTDRTRSRLFELAPVATVAAALRRGAFGLGRVASGFGTTAGRAAAWASVHDAAAALDRLLLLPWSQGLADRSLVVSPTSALSEVPWSVLPSCRARPVSVAPSLSAWCRERTRNRPPRLRALAAAGPGLAQAAPEARTVAACYPSGRTLAGERSTVAAVLSGLGASDVAHLAAHGRLRADNPLLSEVTLADGPLTGYDLERVEGMPRTVVLPSCHAGRGRAPAGDETLGLAWTLLAGGAGEVVAPLTAVPDDLTAALMVALHRRLAAQEPAAAALAAVQAAIDPDDARAAATAASFVVFGG